MASGLLIPHRVALPTAAQLSSYLRGRGWRFDPEPDERWARCRRTNGDDELVLEVPLLHGSRGYERAVLLLVEEIARIEDRSVEAVVRDTLSEGRDLLRLHLDGESVRSGRLTLEAGRGVYAGVRDLFAAVAASVVEPRQVHPARRPAEALELLQRLEWGPPEHGSFVAVIENPLPPFFMQTTLFSDDTPVEPPPERRLTLAYVDAMAAVARATRRAAVEDSLDAFAQEVDAGLSANLCEAVAQILTASDAQRIGAHASLGGRWPAPSGWDGRRVVVERDVVSIVREAARHMRAAATYEGIHVSGAVVKLESGDTSTGGVVALRAETDEGRRTVWVQLTAADYALALETHRQGGLIELTGDLGKQGRRWWVTHPRQVRAKGIDDD